MGHSRGGPFGFVDESVFNHAKKVPKSRGVCAEGSSNLMVLIGQAGYSFWNMGHQIR